MAALLEERAKRRSGKAMQSEEKTMSKDNASPTSQSLQSLVDSVKRKSSNLEGKGTGKRRKV